MIEPSSEVHRDLFGREPEFQIHGDSIADQYGAGLVHEPDPNTDGAFVYTADVFAIAGTSGSWALWAQRDWEFGLLRTADAEGPWLDSGVNFFSPFEPFDFLRAPAGWGMPLTEADLSMFRANLRAHQSG